MFIIRRHLAANVCYSSSSSSSSWTAEISRLAIAIKMMLSADTKARLMLALHVPYEKPDILHPTDHFSVHI